MAGDTSSLWNALYGIRLQELKTLFDTFDKDGNGTLSFDEFLEGLRVSGITRTSVD